MEIMFPQSGENTVMQVNMGEGKSSVIIPIAAAALADGKQLVRVIVPKSLTVQMFDLLVARLGGLTNRPIYHLPFSRTPEYDSAGRVISLQIDDLHQLMSQCMAERGILLVQPEHVVSLKLMSVEEHIRRAKLMIDPSTTYQNTIYKVASSLRLVRMDEYILVIVDSADCSNPDTERQSCEQHVSIAEAIAKLEPLEQDGHSSGREQCIQVSYPAEVASFACSRYSG